jgi:DNA-binding LacI/PurR family transcriptional regulator
MPSEPTLRDIARLSGVTVGTVSLALRNSPVISAATRDRVRVVAIEAGWKPNPLVSAWMAHRRRTKVSERGETIGFINLFQDRAFWQRCPSFTRFVAGAQERAEAVGYVFEEFWLGAPGMTHGRLNKILKTRGIRALIIGSSQQPSEQLELDWQHFAAVAQGYSVRSPQVIAWRTITPRR